jgi:hypothetical protein
VSVEVTERPAPQGETERRPLIRLRAVQKYFPITRGILFQRHIGDVHAVDGVDLDV